jgi:hypothetical protein
MSTVDSSQVTTTTTVSIFASNTAQADLSFSQLSATLSLPTPIDATPLPSLTPTSQASSTSTASGAATGFATGTAAIATGSGLALSGALENPAPVRTGTVGLVVFVAAVIGPLFLAIRL